MLSADRLRFLSAIVLLFVLISTLAFSVSASTSREAAISTVSEAEQSVAQAYEAVLDAEAAGADVSGLLIELNNAVELFSEARMAFEDGDFEEATRLADLANGVGSEVAVEAERLKVEANSAGVDRFWWLLVGSVLGVSVVASVSFLGYRYFKRWYFRRLLKMRPRVGRV